MCCTTKMIDCVARSNPIVMSYEVPEMDISAGDTFAKILLADKQRVSDLLNLR